MLCAIYRSPRRADTYLYLTHPADFSKVPEPLLGSFGQPIHVMTLALTKDRKLARMSVAELREHLTEQGFYLQMPPKQENLLEQHQHKK